MASLCPSGWELHHPSSVNGLSRPPWVRRLFSSAQINYPSILLNLFFPATTLVLYPKHLNNSTQLKCEYGSVARQPANSFCLVQASRAMSLELSELLLHRTPLLSCDINRSSIGGCAFVPGNRSIRGTKLQLFSIKTIHKQLLISPAQWHQLRSESTASVALAALSSAMPSSSTTLRLLLSTIHSLSHTTP